MSGQPSTSTAFARLDKTALVKAVEKFKCLYDHNSPDYCKREKREIAWQAIGQILEQNPEECKKIWGRIRNALVGAMKVNQTYYLQEELNFLMPFLKNKPKEDADEDEDLESLTPNDDRDDTIFATPPTKKRKEPEVPELSPNDMRMLANENNSRKYFLLSLLPEVEEFTQKQMRAFRRKVFTLIDEIVIYK